MTNKKLSIIIVTFESAGIIESCLSKINFDRYQVFVVDNNSRDETTKIISEKFPQANLIKLPENIGYGRANNIALKKTNTDYALILNPDAFIEEDDIEEVINIMDQDNKIALSSPKIDNSKDFKNVYQRAKGSQKKEKSNNQNLALTNFIAGCVMFMNMKIFRKIGFFDERIFMFCEDNEISSRSIENGYKNVIINNLLAFHSIGSSSKKSLKNIYRRNWHIGWSKCHWKKTRKNWFNAKRSTSRILLLYLGRAFFNLIKLENEKTVADFAFSAGCFSNLIGLEAFDKTGKPRG